MVNLIPNAVKTTWDDWNIRVIILLSLSFQIFLILFSPLRNRIRKAILTLILWSTYQLADHAANFCIGLIVNKCNRVAVKDNILAFWGPFLLLHLGGQDTITAFSLEDNELWLRHLLSFVFQLVLTVYVFGQTIPGNTLWLPTVLVFFAGIIKYIERTRSLYLASMDTFRKSVMDSKGPSDARRSNQVLDTTLNGSDDDQQTEADHVELVQKGYEYFEKFKGFVADKTYRFVERNESRQYFLRRTPKDALTIIEVELNFIYEYFFTKVSVLRTKVGRVLRLAGSSLILAALLIFFFDKKHGFSKLDVEVTYALLLGAVGLEFVAFLRLILSDWAAITLNVLIFLRLKKSNWSDYEKEPFTSFKALPTNPLFGRWSGTISGHDLITYWMRKSRDRFRSMVFTIVVKVISYFGGKELLEKWRFKTNTPFLQELWEFIFSELRSKSMFANDAEKVKIICEARGRWIIEKGDLEETKKEELKPYVNSNEVAFEDTLIVWHIATTIWYHEDHQCSSNHRYFSKVLSDYMLYLLAMEPAIMSAVAGIGQQRIIEITSSLEKISSAGISAAFNLELYSSIDPADESDICRVLLSGNLRKEIGDSSESEELSMLDDAVALARKFKELEENKGWKIIAQVWVEMLSYAAINCRPDALVQQLSKGGQLISFVWLSMLHLGLGSRQFKK